MKIRIIQIGKNKDKYIEEGVNEYLKRISPFAKIDIETLKEVHPTKTFTRERCIEEEGEQILKSIKDDEFAIVLDENGNKFNSKEFAVSIRDLKDSGQRIVFVIGGAFGHSASVKTRANLLLSFSRMTFTHQMIRLILLEQIYRAYTIISGKDYHH